MTSPEYDALKGSYVQFRIRDVYLPDPAAILLDLHGSDVLEGKVLDLSDNGTDGGVFVVIEVAGFYKPVIVGVERLLPPSERGVRRPTGK